MALLTKIMWRVPALLVALGGLTRLSPAGGSPEQVEYEVKGAFLYNFAKFVQWPSDAIGAGQPLRLCVFGHDPFGHLLESSLNGKTVGEKPIEVGHASDPHLLTACQVVFIGAAESSHTAAILEIVSPHPVLTVSETPGFAASGGIVNFYIEDRRVRFEINPKAAARSGLRVSSQLLKLARIVDAQPGSSK